MKPEQREGKKTDLTLHRDTQRHTGGHFLALLALYVRAGGKNSRLGCEKGEVSYFFVVPSCDRTVASKALDDFRDPMPSYTPSFFQGWVRMQFILAHDYHLSDHLNDLAATMSTYR